MDWTRVATPSFSVLTPPAPATLPIEDVRRQSKVGDGVLWAFAMSFIPLGIVAGYLFLSILGVLPREYSFWFPAFYFFAATGLVQWAWIVPMVAHAWGGPRRPFAEGLLFGAAGVFMINVVLWVFFSVWTAF